MSRIRNGSCAFACAAIITLGCVPSLKDNPARAVNTTTPGGFSGKSAPGNAAQKDWNDFFTDPELRALINTALRNNQELNIQLQEIIIANSEVLARQGEYQPQVNAGAGLGGDKVGRHTSQGRSNEAHNVPEPTLNAQAGFSASWEVDIWKKLRNATKAAAYRYLSTIEGRNFVVTRLVAEVANSYYELRALDRQLEVLQQNIEIQLRVLEIVKLQKEAARVTQLAVQRFDSDLKKNKSLLFERRQQRVEVENRINLLLGRYPQQVSRSTDKFEEQVPPVVGAGIPSQLLDNRPDVRQAAYELAAAKLDVKVARAAFYPSLSIEAGVGYQAFNLAHFVDTPDSMMANLGANLTAPLLNRKGIEAAYRSANAMQIQAVLNYERTLVQAFTEVANQLSMIDNLQQSFDLQTQRVDLLTESVDVSNILFQSARADYMEVLLTRREAMEAQIELVETRQRQMQAVVNIYQALGGGWQRSKNAGG